MSDDPYPAPVRAPAVETARDEQGSPYPKADLLPRLLARLFDLMVCGALAALAGRIGAAAGAIYLLLADGLFRGQGLGKRLLGVRVVHLKSRAGAGSRLSALRNFPMALVGLLAMGPVAHWRVLAGASFVVLGYEAYRVVQDPLGRRLGDAVAGTQVVDGKVVAGQPALVGAGNVDAAARGLERLPRRVARTHEHELRTL